MKHSNRLLACLFLLAIALMAGCKSPANKNSAASNTATTGTRSTGTVATDPQALDALMKAVNGQLTASSFRARLDSSINNQETARTIEFVAPDRFHMTGEHDEMVVVGGNAWSRLDGGAWQKLSIDASQIIASVRNSQALDELRKSTDVKLIGPDTLDGKPMTVYEYTTQNIAGKGINSHSKAWVSTADNLPRRVETATEINGQPSKATITYFDYNSDIHIDPPK